MMVSAGHLTCRGQGHAPVARICITDSGLDLARMSVSQHGVRMNVASEGASCAPAIFSRSGSLWDHEI